MPEGQDPGAAVSAFLVDISEVLMQLPVCSGLISLRLNPKSFF